MRKVKKIMALVLAMMLCLAMSAVAFAETPNPGITITNTSTTISIDGKEYKAYKLFDSTHSGEAYAYTMSTSNQFYSAKLVSGEGVAANSLDELLRTYFTFTAVPGDTSKVNVTPKDGFNATVARTFADKMEAFLDGKTETAKATASGEKAEIDLTAAAAGLGYYIVTGTAKAKDSTTTAGKEDVVSAVILTNENPIPVVQPKADVPTLDKKITGVKEGTETQSGAVLDANGQAAVAKVGSTVSYEIDSVVPDMTGYTTYTFTIGDNITAGLTYVADSFKIQYGTAAATSITPTFKNSNKTFEITISKETLGKYDAGTAITLTYDCTVNDSALSYDYENNTANLTYSRDPYDSSKTDKTPDKKTYVIDINLDVDKVAEKADGTKLSGAEFKLYKKDDSDNKLYYKKDTDTITWVSTQSNGDTFTTKDGKLTTQIQGLDKGTYYLEETKAPTGYNLLASPIEIVISVSETDNKVTYTATTNGAKATVTNETVNLTDAQNSNQPVETTTIVNNTGTQLPSTGGIGTTIFYILGALLVVGAGILLVARRRMRAGE